MKLVGGRRLDQGFLADLPVAPGMQVGLYSDCRAWLKRDANTVSAGATSFDAKRLVGANGDVPDAAH